MIRPLTVVLVSYLTGVVLASYFRLPLSLLIPLGILALVLGFFNETRAWEKNRLYFCCAVVVLGVVMCQWQAVRNQGNIEFLAGRSVVLAGTVVAEPDLRINAANYTVRPEEIIEPADPAPDKGTIEPLRGYVLVSVKGPAPIYMYGDKLQVAGVPEIPREPGNPGEFNYKNYLQGKGIQLIIKSRQGAGVEKTGAGRVNPGVDLCLKAKRKLVSVIRETMSEQHAGLMEGILFGSCGRIDAGSRNDFALTGVVHILSVSGYHVGLLVLFFIWVGNILRFNQTWRNILVVLGTSFYAVMTGAGPPVIRAVVMAWVLLLAHGLRQKYDWPSSLSLAALLILLVDPHALFNPGFQLSFGATWGILYLAPLVRPLFSARLRLGQAIAVTVAAQVAVFPLTSYYFNYFSLVSLPANLIIVPLISLLMLTGGSAALAGLGWLPLAQTINVSTGLLLELVLGIARFLAGLPFSIITIKQPPVIIIAIYYLFFIILVETLKDPEIKLRLKRFWLWQRKTALLLILSLAVALLWTSIVYPARPEKLKVTFLDVGQGDAVLIESPARHYILLDTGGVQDPGQSTFNPGEKILVPFLRSQGISKIDLLCLSHPHRDHIQGAEALAESVTVKMLVTNPQFWANPDGARLGKSFSARGVQIQKMTEGEQILVDENVTLEVFSPPDQTVTGENNDSLVIRLGYGEFHLLFTGDAGAPVLQKLAGDPARVQAEVVKVPHHGSKSGWLEQFYRSVNPGTAVISVGPNVFGHPSGQVVDGLSRLGIAVYRTDRNGAVVIRSDGLNYRVETGRMD